MSPSCVTFSRCVTLCYSVVTTHSHTSQIFWDGTQFFSHVAPNLAMVIPAMDVLDEHLTDYSLKENVLLSIRAAIVLAKKTLNRYYGKTNESNTYHIAMGEYQLCSKFHCSSC